MILISALVAVGSIFTLICLWMVSSPQKRKNNREHQRQATLGPERQHDVSKPNDKAVVTVFLGVKPFLNVYIKGISKDTLSLL